MGNADEDGASGARPRIGDIIDDGQAGRVGIVCAQRLGLVFAAASAATVLVPAIEQPSRYLATLVGLLVMLVGFALLTSRAAWWAATGTYLAGLATLASLASFPVYDFTAVATVTAVSSFVIPSLLLAIPDSRMLVRAALPAAVPVTVTAVVASLGSGRAVFVAIAILGGWVACTCAGIWVHRTERQAVVGVEQLRRAYAAERRSVEAEAELRHEARTMHDTVLATLTLIAHGGRGVPAETLRAQASADRDLLRQLRTSGSTVSNPRQPAPPPVMEGAEDPTDPARPAEDAGDLPRWASLARRHQALGLSVAWHGVPQLDDSASHLSELAAAVSECLENVRRHSGQHEAEVTLSQDDDRTRAVVTDLGCGFVPEQVPAGRLGLAESVRARLDAVHGTARIFSSPGRGTTVLLEVPRR
ncbi:ATP-binding protein [Cnuibacter sp. UC19_7]|uniref:sensor histidine kinase n=1 Tax=Cnuibacter sp. UC19_7 TaxID=3350166 RepID=UPI0036711F75